MITRSLTPEMRQKIKNLNGIVNEETVRKLMIKNRKSAITYYSPNFLLILFLVIGGCLLIYHFYDVFYLRKELETKNEDWGLVAPSLQVSNL